MDIGTPLATMPNNFAGEFPDRVNLIPQLLIEGDLGVINVRVSGTNTVGLNDLPASNNFVDAWEVSFM